MAVVDIFNTDKKYNIIYADPPWHYNFRNRKGLSDKAKAKLYETMTPQELCALPIERIANDNCLLCLWVMNSEIPLALSVIESWGFTFKTVAFTWVKTRKNTYHFGGGNWTRSNPEICLLATRGHVSRVSASVPNLVVAPLEEHSKKPAEIRDRIVRLLGDMPRIELFARQHIEGWDCWGNEV